MKVCWWIQALHLCRD